MQSGRLADDYMHSKSDLTTAMSQRPKCRSMVQEREDVEGKKQAKDREVQGGGVLRDSPLHFCSKGAGGHAVKG